VSAAVRGEGGPPARASRGLGARALDALERAGNKLPDPALLFVLCLIAAFAASALLAGRDFGLVIPATGEPLRVKNQLTGAGIAEFLTEMVGNFASFPPLGLVLVALLGVGVADHSGFIPAALKKLLAVTPRHLLTPMVIGVGILSHSAADAGFVLVIPLGGVIFAAAGRHPLTGIAAAFAGVSGGFSANPIPSSLDALVQGLTQSAVRIVDPAREVNVLCNWYFNATATLLIVGIGWWITERVVDRRTARIPIDGEASGAALALGGMSADEKRGLRWGTIVLLAGLTAVVLVAWPADSPLRSPRGELAANDAPLIKSIVPLIFLLFLLLGIVYGYVSGRYRSHRDVVAGLGRSMASMGEYLVLAFFAAQFIAVFNKSNLGALLALQGADWLRELGLGGTATIVGIVLISAGGDLVIGSCSAKWALMAPILVPMMMQLGWSPELTQAAYRIGDSTSNIITPLMPYFPLVIIYCQRHCKSCGIGTLVSLMLPYSLAFLAAWSALLLAFWKLGIPLGVAAPFRYP